ncbi:bifunctional adenosylcobinamide kinase/adenosylcobinamide-phosphate guanylyltransferase [Microlunatus endophyticus]|uniref:bifunctional adenosylcobinamide kinase/adenosylcobinamide-phosphate guanylyltransferase n=1 Tax=Microlunatus endophyticus TaxID=1716077 RepID=UPI001E330781|nr:bifunctional adenosylcobinamide kinase/adenosylcobinamide-phosphate guanylyltransferase [Microlunatus endophyticus]
MVERTARTFLITGGVRSGKSTYAERLAESLGAAVSYVATGPQPSADDPEWAARVADHRARRPSDWTTIESLDLGSVLDSATGTVLIDCFGTWTTAVIDELDGWDAPTADWKPEFDDRLQAVVSAWQSCDRPIVAVSNEVGWGVVPAYRSGRIFADLLGEVNRTIAAISDQLVLMVAGRPMIVPAPAGRIDQ